MYRHTTFSVLLLAVFTFTNISAKTNYTVIKLWDQAENRKERRPELRIFFPKETQPHSSLCMLICPGGSYHHLGLTNEGSEVAEYLNQWGITAVVLRYRVAMRGNHHPAMIEDFQRAMSIIRGKEGQWRIKNIGCIGFSAGGHLACMGGAFHEKNFLEVKKTGATTAYNLCPDFICAIYPVVSMQDSIAHKKSRKCLLTESYTQKEMDGFSIDQQIPNDMPPVFLLACRDDDVVDYRNSEVLHQALEEKNIPHEYHLFDEGGHGFGFIRTHSKETNGWPILLKKWLEANNFLAY